MIYDLASSSLNVNLRVVGSYVNVPSAGVCLFIFTDDITRSNEGHIVSSNVSSSAFGSRSRESGLTLIVYPAFGAVSTS